MHLYETHLPVANTEIAKAFYTEIVGLPFAYRDPTRDIVFFWAASKGTGWSVYGDQTRRTGGKTGLCGDATWLLPCPWINWSQGLRSYISTELKRLDSAATKRTSRPLLGGCRQRRFIFEIPMGTCSNSSASCQIRRTQVSTDRTRNGKN